ncbi:MAG: hypothetical protein U0894_20670 [Pirellulales bacterium]
MADWLAARQSEVSGRIMDSVHKVPGTYADGFAALTFALLGREASLERALAVSLCRPIESEFDSLAQALIRKVCAEKLEISQLYDGNQLVSNNWAIFRALTRELCGLSGDFSLMQRQLESGLFPDSPLGQATPTCYHAKICAVLALRAHLCDNGSASLGPLRRGLGALVRLVSPQGALTPYGRSRNTLFAYGSAYLALRLGASFFQQAAFSWAAARILGYMSQHQLPDGHIPAALNENEWVREDWDVYINNPDYNAFAAACLLLAVRLAPHPPEAVAPADAVSDLGPLLTVRSQGTFFACSTTGEFAPFGSPFFCDTRYAGMVPLLFDNGTSLRVFDRNYCWDGRDQTRAVLLDPRVCDWIPYLEIKNKRYWVRQYDLIRWTWQGGGLKIEASGRPTYCSPRRSWQRFLESKLRRLPARQVNEHKLESRLDVDLHVDLPGGRIRRQSKLHGSTAPLKRPYLEENLCVT